MVPGLGSSEPIPPPYSPPSYLGLSLLIGSSSLLTALYVSPAFYSASTSYFDAFLSRLPPEIQNPLNLSLIALIGLFGWPIVGDWIVGAGSEPGSDPGGSYSWLPAEWPKSMVWVTMNPMQLRKFDGRDGGRVLLAIQRKIYDVSHGRGFYGPGGPYGNFAGRDATRGLAKQSFEDDMLSPVDGPIDEVKDLTESEWKNLRDWETHFGNKYFVCGDLVENS